MKQSEKQIENQILFYLNTIPGFLAFKINNVGVFDQARKVYRKPHSKWIRKGVSDILGCYEGKMIAIEVKVPERRNNTTIHQKIFLDDVKKSGGLAGVATCLEDVDKIIGLNKFKKAC